MPVFVRTHAVALIAGLFAVAALFSFSGIGEARVNVPTPGRDASPEIAPLDNLMDRLLEEPQPEEPEHQPQPQPRQQQQSVEENPLENAVEGMREAQQRLGREETGAETQEVQQKVVDDLQKLIDLAQQRQSRTSQRQAQQRQQQPNMPQQGQPENRGVPDQPQQPRQDQPGQQNRQRPEDSEENNRSDQLRPAELLQRQRFVEEIWGHLPPVVRERMRNVISEKYLPNYEDQIRRYFKSLADEEAERDER